MNNSILLIGGPDAGKTNFLGRFWLALTQKNGQLKVTNTPPDISYVESAVRHILQGEFAPHSSRDARRNDFTASVELPNAPVPKVDLVVPDVSGELWTRAVETREIEADWMQAISDASGALLFVRVLSDSLCSPLDWVTAKKLLQHGPNNDEAGLPTQVFLAELLTFLEDKLSVSGSGKPRVAVIVTAWDLLDEERKVRSPSSFIEEEFPMFAGRMRDATRLDVQVFGSSAVGGDLGTDPDFRRIFLESDAEKAGYIVLGDGEGAREETDFTIPVAWVLNGERTPLGADR